MTRRPWTGADRATLRQLRSEGRTYAEIGAMLGRTAHSVSIAAQTIGLAKRGAPAWTKAEQYQLIALIESHHSYEDAARILGRGAAAVRKRCGLLGCLLVTANGRSLNATARLLGVHRSPVRLWVRRGWLRAHNTGSRIGMGTVRIVEHEDLLAFLETREYWPVWDPERIKNRRMRAWATEMRGGVRWLTTTEAADRLCLSTAAVGGLIREGRIKAVKLAGGYHVREADCVHPAPLPKPRGQPIGDAEREQIRRWWGIQSAEWIARQIGCSQGAVLQHAARMGLPKLGRGYWRRWTVRENRMSLPSAEPADATPRPSGGFYEPSMGVVP